MNKNVVQNIDTHEQIMCYDVLRSKWWNFVNTINTLWYSNMAMEDPRSTV